MQKQLALSLIQRISLDSFMFCQQKSEQLDDSTEVWSCIVAAHVWPDLADLAQWTLLSKHEVAGLAHELELREEIKADGGSLCRRIVLLGASCVVVLAQA